jgi:eukaryotic-like serine/threonine-protein kinase
MHITRDTPPNAVAWTRSKEKNDMRHHLAQRPAVARGRFRIVGILGAGGMGVVYDAIDRQSGRRVAVKVLRRRDRRAAQRELEREALAMALVSSSRTCRVFDVSTVAGYPCLAMERLVGETLQTRLSARRMATREVIETAAQIAAALAAVHRAGLVHFDLKPANVFLMSDGIKLLDFGLTVAAGAGGGSMADSRTDEPVLGTTNYIAPERILRRPADPRSDLFSLGALIYEMAAGRPPFAASSPAEVLFNVLEAEPPPIKNLTSAAATAVDRLARRLLAKNPAHRCRTAREVRRTLEAMRTRRQTAARFASPASTFDRDTRCVPCVH